GPSIFYIDSDGTHLKGDLFSVGSGSPFAYGVVDSEFDYDLSKTGREINEEKKNEAVISVKRKTIEKDKKNKKGKEQLEVDEESFMLLHCKGFSLPTFDALSCLNPTEFLKAHTDKNSTAEYQIKLEYGTMTLLFKFQGGIIVAIDSHDASAGSFITIPTVRKLGRHCRLYELRNKERISIAAASKLLANMRPSIFYIDSDGIRLKGDLFSVGSGSPFAYEVKTGREINEEKKNEAVTTVKIKAIEKDKFRKKSKKNEKGKEQLEADEKSFMVSTSILFNYSSISKIYLSEIVQNSIPNLIGWILSKRITYLFFGWSCFKNIVGKPDFVIVDNNIKLLMPWKSKTNWVLKVLSNQNIVTLYNNEKEVQEELYAYSGDVSVYHPINQMYGYMCTNKLRYGILSTYDQTWFLERGVVGEDHGWLHISDTITNSSTDPTLLKSVAYIKDLTFKNRYVPFLEKPVMIADNVDEESDSSDKEQKGDSDFNLFPKNSNVITRKQNHQ
ncbi:hypothetical protein C1646_772746, partial [Rhizophagus diaphanus]